MHDLLQPAVLDGLPADIKAAVDAVCSPNAALSDFDPILVFLQSDEEEEQTKLRLLPALARLLDPARITAEPDPVHVTLAWAALRVLPLIAGRAAAAAKELWAPTLQWLLFFYALPEYNVPAVDKVLLALFFALSFHAGDGDDAVAQMLSVPGSIKAMFAAWARVFGEPTAAGFTERATDDSDRDEAAQAMFGVLVAEAVYTREGLQQAVEGAGGTLESLGQVLYRHLDFARCELAAAVTTAEEDGDAKLELISGCVHSAAQFLRRTEPLIRFRPIKPNPLLDAMLERGLVALLCDIMYTYSTVTRLNFDPMIMEGLVEPAFDLISFIVSFPPHHHHIPDVIRHRFLEAMVNLAPADFHNDTPQNTYLLKGFFNSILPAALVRTNVLEALGDVLPGLEASVATDAFKGTQFFKNCWEPFHRVAEARLSLFQRYRAGEFPPRKMCDSLKEFAYCRHVGPESEFKRCSGCRVVVYCSEACQKVDWREGGHKKGCAALRQYRQHHDSLDLTPEDRDFLRVLMDADYQASGLHVTPMRPGDTTVFRYGENPGRVERNREPPCSGAQLFGADAAAREILRRVAYSEGTVALDVAEFWSGVAPSYALMLRRTHWPANAQAAHAFH
ncbi:MYND-type domain-containing protein [Mycena indigotica]|uniref:MYND-type domain-containing protein n=1 Tax=Mycena indigotica TaxID=2126181 RepID=A0A8H6T3F9_9AGAR|nr:MYND-type domain-containing protein [Mycena indigotica]KAF7310189.1 MYND-type domain-containing protein [Mycena indigotica]